jgi:two-component system phosphate regulon sensor histidine kinase PhoR
VTLSLRGRLFITHALVALAALIIVTLLGYRAERRWVIGQIERELELATRHAAQDLAAQADWESVAARIHRETGYRATLIDAAGRVLGDSDVPRQRLAGVENHAGREEVRAALDGRVGRSSRRSRTVGVELVYVAVPLPSHREVRVLRLAEPLQVVSALQAELLRMSILAGVLALLLSVPIVAWVAGREAARARDLVAVSRRLGLGDPAARARERPADELGRLGRAINEMAAEGRLRLAALEQERDEREQILAHLAEGVALIGEDGQVLRMNRAFAALVGAPLPAPAGTPLPEFARSPELDRLIESARAESRSLEADLRPWTPEQRLVHATATPLSGPSRGTLLVALHDLSEAERLNRMRQDFVANVSHELRTPLTSLRGYAETLLDGGLDDPENREGFVRVIRDQAVRLEAITQDLLTLAGLERTDARVQLESFELREATARQVAGLGARAAAGGLALTLEPGPDVTVRADRGMVDQLLANLLDNALKYTEHGGVRVRLGEVGPRVWCEVEDTGCGIPEPDLPRVFERFYRVDKARSREKGGTGLGLSIVKHIVTLHEGEVSVRSRLDEGSVFRFEIPREGPTG